MARLQVHPRHAERLRQLNLQRPEDFLALRGVVVSGHPDRHVQAVALPGYRRLFLKKEHRTRLAQRWESWWRGHGAVALCCREFAILRCLADAGISCPEPLAAGESNGEAFLLLQEVEGTLELRRFLQQHPEEATRRQLAAALGDHLARVHAAGFDHPDLYSKHVLVQLSPPGWREGAAFSSPASSAHLPSGGANLAIILLDWPRTQRRQRVSLRIRCRDLAALDATLAEELASPRLRLRCLATYLRTTAALLPHLQVPEIGRVALTIRRRAVRLQRLRRVRELHLPPLPEGSQDLIWLEGEALCVTRRLHEQLGGCLPEWLLEASQGNGTAPGLAAQEVTLPDGSRAHLTVRQQQTGPARWWRRGRLNTPELAIAATLFRLQRQGVPAPGLLAFGQRQTAVGPVSFLLREASGTGKPLADWLATQPPSPQRRAVLRQVGGILRRLHQANYQIGEEDCIVQSTEERCAVVLGAVATLKGCQRWSPPTAAEMAAQFPHTFQQCSCWERHYLLLHCLNLRRLPDRTRLLALGVQERAAQTSVRSHA